MRGLAHRLIVFLALARGGAQDVGPHEPEKEGSSAKGVEHRLNNDPELPTATYNLLPILPPTTCTTNEDCEYWSFCEAKGDLKRCHMCRKAEKGDCPLGYMCIVTTRGQAPGTAENLFTGQCLSEDWSSNRCGDKPGECCCMEKADNDASCKKNSCDSVGADTAKLQLPGPLFCDCASEDALDGKCGKCVAECPALSHLEPLHWGNEKKSVGMACMPGIAAAPPGAAPSRMAVAAAVLVHALVFVHAHVLVD